MNAKEAYKIIKDQLNDVHVLKCMEYNKVFVFNICSNKEKLSETSKTILWGVNKDTGESKRFMPYHLSPEEYRNGKEVNDFR